MQFWEYLANDPAATERLGRELAQAIFPGAVVGLVGPLGAGKTRLVQAAAEALGADRSSVASPTFVLIHEYAARLPIYHFDAYRLHDAADFADLRIDEYFFGEGVCLVEWADRVSKCMPDEFLEVGIEITGPSSRQFLFRARGRRYEELLEALHRSLS